MKMFFVLASCAALGLSAASHSANGQGPVRQGLRRTGEIAVDGTRRVVQGAAQGTRAVVGGAADVTRGVVRGTAQGVRAGVTAITPGTPLQARGGANLQASDDGRDARWRFAQHNGEWWYYSPQNAWMYHRDGEWNEFAQDSFQANPQTSGQGEYATGYRGVEGGDEGYDQYGDSSGDLMQGPVHTLQQDEHGREFICDNGQRVYFDDGQAGQATMNDQAAGEGGTQPTPAPTMPQDPNAAASVEGDGPTAETSSAQGANQGQSPATEAPREVNNSPASTGDNADATPGAGIAESSQQ